MDYQKTEPFNGDKQKTFDLAKNILFAIGFEMLNQSDFALEFINKQMLLSGRQNPLSGISYLSIQIHGNQIEAQAGFGNLRKMFKFLAVFLIAMAMFFIVLFSIVFKDNPNDIPVSLIAAAPLLPWIFIGPTMYFFFKKRTQNAMDILIKNIAAAV